MPSMNVRLTEEQHAELVAAAHENMRSLQKEIVARLFDGLTAGGRSSARVGGNVREEGAGLRAAAHDSRPPAASPEETQRVLPPHRADPKEKAAQEHWRRVAGPAKGLCPHRVPLGSYCKRCEEES